MNKIKLACGIASLALATQAFALTQVETSGIVPVSFLSGPGFVNPAVGTPSGGAISTGPDLTLTVPGFTAAAGIYLQSVSYVLETWTYATYTLQNFEATPADHGVGWRLLNAKLVLPAGAGPDVTGISTPTSNYDIFGLLPGPANAESGTTASSFNARPSASGGANAPYLAPSVNFTFTPTASGSVSGTTGNSIPSVFVAARVTVTYTYSDVPEASTYAAGAFLLAGAGFVVRRRMAAK